MGYNLLQATRRPSADCIKKTITVLVSVGAFLDATITALAGRKKWLLASSCLTDERNISAPTARTVMKFYTKGFY